MEESVLNQAGQKLRQWSFLGWLIVLIGLTVFFVAKILVTERNNFVGTVMSAEQETLVLARNSPLTQYIALSPHAYFPRSEPIQKITIHHMAGELDLETLGDLFSRRDRTASANYGIDKDGRVGLYVEERNAAWTSSSSANDAQAVTIEVANDELGGDWHVSDAALNALIDLVTDICLRNSIEVLEFTGDETGNLTLHRMFKDTECPGPYLTSRMDDIVSEVNRRLSAQQN